MNVTSTKRRKFSDDERATILAALAANGGNVAKTAAETGVSERTIRSWKNGERHPEAAQMCELKKGPLADQFEELAYRLLGVAVRKLDGLNAKDAIIAAATATDKMRLLRGQSAGSGSFADMPWPVVVQVAAQLGLPLPRGVRPPDAPAERQAAQLSPPGSVEPQEGHALPPVSRGWTPAPPEGNSASAQVCGLQQEPPCSHPDTPNGYDLADLAEQAAALLRVGDPLPDADTGVAEIRDVNKASEEAQAPASTLRKWKNGEVIGASALAKCEEKTEALDSLFGQAATADVHSLLCTDAAAVAGQLSGREKGATAGEVEAEQVSPPDSPEPQAAESKLQVGGCPPAPSADDAEPDAPEVAEVPERPLFAGSVAPAWNPFGPTP